MNEYSNERRMKMRKTYHLKNLDCANCATKMEIAAKQVEGVENISINFMTQKMKLEAPESNYEDILAEIKNKFKKIEPDCELEER